MTKTDEQERLKARRERKRALGRGIEEFRERVGDPTPMMITPQALHHWNRNDQIDELVQARNGEPDIGFIMRLLALCTLPRTNPGDRQQYRRVNGPYTLYVLAGGDEKLPYGTLPRLLLAWVCSEAVRTQSRTLVLGRSLAEFMRDLGIQSSDSGGQWGVRTRLRNQDVEAVQCVRAAIVRDGAQDAESDRADRQRDGSVVGPEATERTGALGEHDPAGRGLLQ